MARNAQKGAAAVAQKWADRTGAAVQDWADGVSAVQKAPGVSAAAKKADYVRRVQERADRWAARVQKVTLEQWRSTTLAKGQPILAGRAQMAKSKMGDFMAKFLPAIYSARDRLPPRQKGNIEVGMSRVRGIVQAAMDFAKQNQ